VFLFYIIPNNYNISVVLLIGFAVVILGFYLFINLNHSKKNSYLFQIKICSENLIKILLILIMSITLLIPPISKSKAIIIWDDVGILNYLRAISFLIGCSFLPGGNLYNIFFHKDNLHEQLKVEPFFLKITVYPLLSFSFIGISVLILDQIGIFRDLFAIFLFIFILGLFILDLIIQQIRDNKIEIKSKSIGISRYTFIILIISLGVLLISLGIHFGIHYLIPGDAWVGLAPANYIGTSNSSPIEWGRTWSYYPIFWSYISFGLSVMCGLPFVNTNALLAPFSYLYVTSLYLMVKIILSNYKEKYAVLSTILITISSNLFYSFMTGDYGHGGTSDINFVCEFYFIYKSYSYLLFLNALTFFVIITKIQQSKEINDNYLKNLKIKLSFLVAFFLVISYMLYLIPILIGIIFIFLYCLFSEKKKQDFKIFSNLTVYITLLFFSFDVLMEFYLSSSLYYILPWFVNIPIISQVFNVIPSYILIYSLLGIMVMMSILIQRIFSKDIYKKNKNIFEFKINSKMLFRYCLITFLVLFIIEMINITLEILLDDFSLINKIIFFYYLDNIFLRLGFIGLLSVLLSYFTFKMDRKLFQRLFSWIFVLTSLASILIAFYSLQNLTLTLNAIDKRDRLFMIFWFKRVWTYSIFPLGILAAIGLFRITKLILNHPKYQKIFKSNNRKLIIKLSSFSLLVFLAYSNLIFIGIWSGNINNRPKDEEIELLNWMSKNVPPDSKILMEKDYVLRVGIFSMVNGRYYFIEDYFDRDNNITENIEVIEDLKDEDMEYMLISEDFLYGSSNRSKFIRHYLRPNFYNETEHETNHYRLYYAPYFD